MNEIELEFNQGMAGYEFSATGLDNLGLQNTLW